MTLRRATVGIMMVIALWTRGKDRNTQAKSVPSARRRNGVLWLGRSLRGGIKRRGERYPWEMTSDDACSDIPSEDLQKAARQADTEELEKASIPPEGWVRLRGMDSGYGLDSEVCSMFSEVREVAEIAEAKGYGGFVLFHGNAFFREMCPDQLIRCMEPTKGCDTYVWMSRPTLNITVDREANISWVQFMDYEAMHGIDTESIHNNPSLENCKKICDERGYSGFVLRKGTCHFKNQTYGVLRRERAKSEGCRLYIKIPYVVEGDDFTTYANRESFPGEDAHVLYNFHSLYDCQLRCLEGNYTGFVTWNGNAYFRKKCPEDLVDNSQYNNRTDLHVWTKWKPTPPKVKRQKVPETSKRRELEALLNEQPP
ncbi:hypothetical protein AAMO2058_001712700 [Amorphochlora amoebiformis]